MYIKRGIVIILFLCSCILAGVLINQKQSGSEHKVIKEIIRNQEVCPVSNQMLGSMGEPIAVNIDEQTIYVCCSGCIDRLKENPEKFLDRK